MTTTRSSVKSGNSSPKSNPGQLNITRRDFIGGTLIGAGAALLGAPAPAFARYNQPGVFNDPWTGFAGVGDYARSNGNTAQVRDAAHLVRDGKVPNLLAGAVDTGEVYDLVIVGGGFSGAGAAYRFKQQFGDSKTCLVLENHPVFGGEAKQNEFDVDGYRLYGPQGSNGFLPPSGNTTLSDEVFRAVGMPMDYAFASPANSSVVAPMDSYECMYWGEEKYDTGYFVQDQWVRNPWRDALERTPWSREFRQDLVRAYRSNQQFHDGEDYARWLDSMSYQHYLENVMGLDPAVTRFLDPVIAIANFGLSSDVISAYAAHLLYLPGTTAYGMSEALDLKNLPAIYSFPGGNTGYYRHIVKFLNPAAITGGASFEEILNNPIDFPALDRQDQSIRFRLNATALDVRHDGDPGDAETVSIVYQQDGQVKRLRTRSVVMAIGGWVSRNIVADMPPHIRQAYQQFHHGPVLVVNVALTNWRFLDRLGISAARWFEGFGTFCSIRRPMEVGASTQPFDPDKPTVLTFYVPFNFPGHDSATQGSLGRAELLSHPYAHYEQQLLAQMNALFSSAGFDASRDVAGIVLNRWGHAYVSPQPGFYFGANGQPAPKDVVKAGFGRIQFGHSELGARMNYRNAIAEGGRAADEAIKLL